MRDYQKECIEVIHNHFKTHDRQIIQLPTGSGKTWIFCEYLSKYSNKALIICPSIELKEQILDTAKRFNIKSISDNPRDNNKNHVVTSAVLSYENTRKILFSKNYDHIVIDEAHHANSKTYTEFLSSLINKPKILGCTATPERLDGKSLLDVFETLTYKKNIYELIKNGFLADILAYRIKTNQDIAKRGSSDFRATELRILDNESRNNLIYKTFKENCRDKKTIIFCISVEHCIKISDYLKSQGVNSAYIHGKMNNKKRQEIATRYLSEINNPKIILPQHKIEENSHVYHVFVVRTEDREKLQEYLNENGVQTLIHYPIPPHHQEAYKELQNYSLPITEKIHREVLSLPMSQVLTQEEVSTVINLLNLY